MGIPGGHRNRLVSHEFLQCFQVYPSHHQTASEGVPEGVPGDALNLGLFEGGSEHRLVAVGYWKKRLHVLCFLPRTGGIRVISSRKANDREARKYGTPKTID